jgi:phage gp36-like protein
VASYITPTELQNQGVPAGGLSGITNQQQLDAIQWASDEIDGYLAKRFTLPLVTVSIDINRRCAILSTFYLLSFRGMRVTGELNELITKLYDDANKWLLEVSKGNITPQCIDSTPEVDEEGSLVASGPKISFRTFTGPQRHGDDDDFDGDPL